MLPLRVLRHLLGQVECGVERFVLPTAVGVLRMLKAEFTRRPWQ